MPFHKSSHSDKVLLITGGTGSFGSIILKKYAQDYYSEIRVLSRDEKKQHDLRSKINCDKVRFIIGDIRDSDVVKRAVKGVNHIFHAAALKQVPSCEFFPLEATKTNILGTNNLLEAAIDAKAESVICLSTDKAAYPINAMGISKALMEKIAIAQSRTSSKTKICVTRYGNVMCSRGSVIPHFIEQIKSKQPLTITDPNMTRFLMTLDEAVALVIHAFNYGNSGDLFIKKTKSCSIKKLAKVLLEIFDSNKEPVYIGKRHGEKDHEVLATKEEVQNSEDMGDFLRIKSDIRNLNYNAYFSEGLDHPVDKNDYNSNNCGFLSELEIRQKLLGIEYIKKELKNA